MSDLQLGMDGDGNVFKIAMAGDFYAADVAISINDDNEVELIKNRYNHLTETTGILKMFTEHLLVLARNNI